MSKTHLDEVDLEILRELQRDGRMTNADLARHVKLSPPSVLQRVRRLEEQGYISKYVAALSAEKLGFSLTVMAQISLSLHQETPIDQFVEAVQAITEIQECYHVSGEFDFLLKVVVTDMPAYEKLIREKLSRIPGVGRIQSCFVLSHAKENSGFAI
jgi:Lrp/AsnC family leucine-responsive transcriptional regulator